MVDIDRRRPVVVLTGAGISKESGLDTFRDVDGIWSTVRIEDVATPEAFVRDPVRVHAFYNERRRGLLNPSVQPNPAHRALAKWQEHWPGGVIIVTQNIDDLHERGGAEGVIHMHGELLKARCGACGHVLPWREDLSTKDVCAACDVIGQMRPHVVWFGEMPLMMETIEHALSEAGLFVSIGTSGNVYPAAGFVAMVRRHGHAHTVELNLEPSEGATAFAETLYGRASELVPGFVRHVLEDV